MTAFAIIAACAAATAVAAAVAWLWWRRRRASLRPTVVLAHGFLGFDKMDLPGGPQAYFRGVAERLEQAGIDVRSPALPAMGGVPERAAHLARFVRGLRRRHITIIAHSMGGLDARYAISRLGLDDCVSELVTIGTPHRGTPLADLATTPVARMGRRIAAGLGLSTDALDWLGSEQMAEFNERVPDSPKVRYFSVVGRTEARALWRSPIVFLCSLFMGDGDHDGVVPSASQQWSEHLLDIPHDHLAQIGWSPGSEAPGLYERIVAELERRRGRRR